MGVFQYAFSFSFLVVTPHITEMHFAAVTDAIDVLHVAIQNGNGGDQKNTNARPSVICVQQPGQNALAAEQTVQNGDQDRSGDGNDADVIYPKAEQDL